MKNIVFSESPKNDIWLSLKNYTYPDNIKAYFDKQQISYDDELITSITGALIQAFEYFNSSKYVSLNTSPLLIYYGSINLFFGISCLLEGKKIRVEGHGMSIETSKLDSHNILETEIILMDKKHAGLKTYAKILNDEDIKYEKWNIQELLYSIPEISSFVSQDDLNLKYVI